MNQRWQDVHSQLFSISQELRRQIRQTTINHFPSHSTLPRPHPPTLTLQQPFQCSWSCIWGSKGKLLTADITVTRSTMVNSSPSSVPIFLTCSIFKTMSYEHKHYSSKHDTLFCHARFYFAITSEQMCWIGSKSGFFLYLFLLEVIEHSTIVERVSQTQRVFSYLNGFVLTIIITENKWYK